MLRGQSISEIRNFVLPFLHSFFALYYRKLLVIEDVMDNRNEDIKLIFSEAYKKKTLQEQTDYLDKECSKDADLRAEVESLLEAYNDVEGFVEKSSALAKRPFARALTT